MNKRFSIIGCQHAHIAIFIEEMLGMGYECAGIYEPGDRQLAGSIAEQFGVPLADRMEDLLTPDISIVGSAAVNNEKIHIIETCAERGKHIMLDKPAVTSRDGYRRLEDVISRGRVQVGMLLTERFHSPVYTLKQQIDQGRLGQLVSIAMRKPHKLNPDRRPPWFFSKEQCGGIVIDLLVHDFDLLRWLTGKEISSVGGYMGKNILPEYPSFYDTASVQALVGGHLICQLYADWHTPDQSWTWGDGRIFVTGTKGFAEVRLAGDPHVSSAESLLLQVTDEQTPVSVNLEAVPVSISEDFLNRISGKPSILTHADILAASKAALDTDEQVHIINAFE